MIELLYHAMSTLFAPPAPGFPARVSKEVCYNRLMDKTVKSGSNTSTARKLDELPQKIGKTKTVKSVFRTSQILQCLAGNISSIKDIAEQCGLSTTTVHRILQSLEESELACQDPIENKYHLGPLFTQLLLTQVNVHRYLIDHANEEINRLAHLFGEAVALDAQVGMQIVTLEYIPSKFNYGITTPIKLPDYSSISQALLSQHSDDEIETILRHTELSPGNPVLDKEKLKKQLKINQLQGYTVYREDPNGITGISAPINNYVCPAAISVIAPEIRMCSIISGVTEELKASAARISDRMKNRPNYRV
jgi:DNA-binding IclR family transcriptional regulator